MGASSSDELEDLRGLVRRFLEDKVGSDATRRSIASAESGDPDLWTQMAHQLGLQGLCVPEQWGGTGMGAAELGAVLEEMGRAGLMAPYFSTVALATQALLASQDSAAAARWFPGIVDGSLSATLAVVEDSGCWQVGAQVTARTDDQGVWLVTGRKSFVIDGATAHLLLVTATVAETGEVGLFAVQGDSGAVERTPVDSLDPTRPLSIVVFDDASAERVELKDGADAWFQRTTDLVLAAAAAEQVGGAARCLDMAVEYAKVREQFGRPIGSFQAIKHLCAELLVAIEAGRSAAYHAAKSLDASEADGSIAAALAAAHCSETFTRAAKDCIQIHGGVGFTWEHDAHLFLRRAKSSQLLFGGPQGHRDRVADLAGI